jgi:hypothetical protein
LKRISPDTVKPQGQRFLGKNKQLIYDA